MLAALETVDPAKPATVLTAAFTRLAPDAGFLERTRAIARMLSDPRGFASTRQRLRRSCAGVTLVIASLLIREMRDHEIHTL